jgi:hypothetical protein
MVCFLCHPISYTGNFILLTYLVGGRKVEGRGTDWFSFLSLFDDPLETPMDDPIETQQRTTYNVQRTT